MNAASAQTPVKVAPKEDPAERAYVTGYKRIFPKFYATLERIESQPEPKFPRGSTKQQKRDIVARADDAVVAAASAAHKEMSALKPTPNLRALHEASLDLLATFRDTNAAYAAAYRGTSRAKAEAAEKSMNERIRAAAARLKQAAANTRERDGSVPKRRRFGNQ